jgi:hypothetical protein
MLEKLIQQELNLLDPDLFLDKELVQGSVMYVVKYNIGSGEMPLPVTQPLPLSTSIVDVVKRQEGDIREAIRSATLNNAIKKMKAKQEMDEMIESSQKEFEKSAKVLHRSGPWKIGSDVTAYKTPEGLKRRSSPGP